MQIQARLAISCFFLFSLPMGAESISNLTGSWQLNVNQSKWGAVKRPQSVEVVIEHNEPSLKYSGKVTDADEGVHTFEFDGAIDGKQYPVKDTYGEGMLAIERVNPRTISSVSKSSDGKHEIKTTTYLSDDGITLTRRITEKRPEGSVSWTELYHRAAANPSK